MRGRSPAATLAASPTMVGAVTTLIVIVAVFLAYNANNGLPFVPVYSRLGRRSERGAPRHQQRGPHRRHPGGRRRVDRAGRDRERRDRVGRGDASAGDVPEIGARLNLKLDKTAEPLPEDSVFRVRYRSTFGLKYLEIVRGTGPDARRRATSSTARTTARTSAPCPTEPSTFTEFASPSRPRTAASRSRPSSTRSTTPSTTRPATPLARTWSASAAPSPAAARR